MKKIILSIVAILIAISSRAQSPDFNDTININQNFNSTIELFPFTGQQVYGIGIKGAVTLYGDTSIVRVILKDSLSLEYMIFESHPMIDTIWSFSFNEECEETCFMDGFIPTSLIIYCDGASIFLDKLLWSTIGVNDPLYQQRNSKQLKVTDKLSRINSYISSEHLIWKANHTPFSDMYYYEKLDNDALGLSEPGAEFYESGIYAIKTPPNGAYINYDYVPSFDWRSRHGANIPETYYFDGDPGGGGWITDFSECQSGCFVDGVLDCSIPPGECYDQNGQDRLWKSTGLCWVFGPVAHIESLINLYLNQHIDINLAEQNIASCAYPSPTTKPASTKRSFEFFRDEGVVFEQAFPFVAEAVPCYTPPLSEQIFIENFNYYENALTEQEVRNKVMADGPIAISNFYQSDTLPRSHARQMVGWDVVEWEDIATFHGGEIPPYPELYLPWVGVTYWIYKENLGTWEYDNGYFYAHHFEERPPKKVFVVPTDNDNFIYSALNTFTSDDIVTVDNDGDGYWNWGIGPKPSDCIQCSDELDGDDNDSGIGPMDSYGFCTIVGTYHSGFETSMDNWKQVDYDDCDWVKFSGESFDWPDSGPNGTPDESTNYLLMAYGHCYGADHAYLESPPIDLADYCRIKMTFAYHKNSEMWGNDDPTSLALDISYDGGLTWQNNFWKVVNDQGDVWHYETLYFPSTVNKVRFHGYFHNEFTHHDMAIDDITIGPDTETSPVVIQGIVEWDGEHTVCSNVSIEPNSQLTLLPGCTVKMFTGCKIIIKRGGKLLIDNALITNNNQNWHGIEVWGNSNQPQLATEQGWVEITNGGTIENSIMGIYTNRPEENSEDNWMTGYTGGIIQANDAHFINNVIALQFWGYDYTSQSAFTDCEFVINDDYSSTQTPVYFTEVRGMNGVTFTNCEFSDESQYYNYLRGIYSFDSYIYVKGKCLNGDPCAEWDNGLFNNLYYGIYAIATTPNRFVDIRNTDFDNNFRSLYISGITNARVTSNSFKVNTTFMENGGYGMYLNTSTGYHVEDNDFFSEGSTPIGVGLIVNNSGNDANEIYRNRFTNLAQGISAQEKNKNPLANSGLQILCNDFDVCSADILIPKPKNTNLGIATHQGSASTDPEDMAGNLFYIPPGPINNDFDDINNRGSHITYYYPLNTSDLRVEPKDYTHNPPYNTVTLYPNTVSEVWTPEIGCPSCIEGGGGGTGLGELLSKIGVAQQKIDSTETLLTMLVDGGNTDELQSDVDNSIPPEAFAIYTELIDHSPYLSDTVVSTAIEKESVLPDVMIRDVMVANPHTAKNEELLNKLDERWTPLPEYMKEQILQGRDIVSMKEKTESKLSRFKLEKARAMNTLARQFEVNGEPDSLEALLESDNDIESKYRLAFLYMQEGDWSQGMDVLTELPSVFDLSKEEQTEYESILEYCRLLESTGGMPADSLAVNELKQIMEIENGKVSMFALNYLIDLAEVEYEEPIQIPEILKSSEAVGSFTSKNNNSGPQLFKITPNPAKDFIMIEYELEPTTKASIEIHDVAGKTVYNIQIPNSHNKISLETQTWNTGMYFATLKINGKVKETVKFSISY